MTPTRRDARDWRASAVCAQTDPNLFYPDKGESARPGKKVCTGCPVRAQCLDWAIEHDERHGIWGGLSDRERRRLKRRTDLDDDPDQVTIAAAATAATAHEVAACQTRAA